MAQRSQLRHTSMDNGLSFLFEPQHEAGTLAVLRGTAEEREYQVTREAIVRWRQTTMAEIAKNLDAIESEYNPFADGLDVLRRTMLASDWEQLSIRHGASIRARLGIDSFVQSVRDAMKQFDEGLDAVAKGKMTLEELSRRHTEMVNVYQAP